MSARHAAKVAIYMGSDSDLPVMAESARILRELEIEFELPRSGAIQLEAETAYQLLPDMGLIFQATEARDRESIARFVTQVLTR